MRTLVGGLRYLVIAMNGLSAVAAILMTALVFSSAVMRYLVGAPLRFSDELTGFLFVSMAFLALPLGLLQRQHISVDLATTHMTPAWRRLADIVASLILLAFAVVFIAVSYNFVSFSQMIDARSEIAALLLWPWMALMPGCIALMLLVALVQLYDTVRVMRGLDPIIEEPRQPRMIVE